MCVPVCVGLVTHVCCVVCTAVVPVDSICCEAVLLTYVLGVGDVPLGLCIMYIAR